MAALGFRPEERIGLIAACLAHAGLVAWLVWQPAPAPLPPPERMTVTLSEDVGLTATTPSPAPEAAPDKGPEPGEPAPVAQTQPAPQPQPQPLPRAQPQPAPAKPAPLPKPSAPKPAVTKPAPAKPAPQPARPNFDSAFAKSSPATKPAARPGASTFDSAFAKGVPGAAGRSTAQNAAAATAPFGPQQQGALRSAIFRQLKPHWSAPQGIDAEKLVTTVRFRLDKSGRLVGEPVQVSQSGQTPANAAQTRRHFEQAVRAIKLAQPFILPPDLYPYWQTVTSTFDRKLSQ